MPIESRVKEYLCRVGIRMVTCMISVFYFSSSVWAQCNQQNLDTLAYESFEQGIPGSWDAPITSDGASWQASAGTIGYYENPGIGNWLFINDEEANQVGEAVLLSAAYDLGGYEGLIKAEFDFLHQSYLDSGFVKLEIWDGEDWWLAFEEREDFSGHISLEVSSFVNTTIQLRWTYSDEGAWSWGMGIDNFLLTVQKDICGDGVCGLEESPEFCPEDCPYRNFPAEGWIPVGKDLNGESVVYRSFKGGTSCDDCSEEIALPFPFLFYGVPFGNVFINANGNLTFEESYKKYTPEPFCLEGPLMIAPFYADADLQSGGKVSYYPDPQGHYFIVTWEEVGYFGCGGDCELRNTFQVVMTDGSIREVGGLGLDPGTNVVFSYGDMQWTTGNSSGGIEGFEGSGATVGLNSGNGIVCFALGHFDRPGYLYYGSSKTGDECPSGAVSYLDYRSFGLNADLGQAGEPGNPVQDIPLNPPVLEATAHESYTELRWEKDSLSEASHFVIDRSPNVEEYAQIAIQQASDHEPATPHQYRYIDSLPPTGKSYYRIRQYQSGGGMTVSEQVSVFHTPGARASNLQIGSLTPFPNPCVDQLSIRFDIPVEGDVYYNVMDIQGRVVRQGQASGLAGENRIPIPVMGLPTGNYILQLKYAQHQQSVKFIKR